MKPKRAEVIAARRTVDAHIARLGSAVWNENGQLVGRAADGTIVALGILDDDSTGILSLAWYLEAHPTPETW